MTLWTPGGEHEVPREPAPGAAGEAGGATPADLDEALADLSPEDRARAEAMVAEMAEARARLTEVPAAVVIANHAMGLYELAAIHLSSQPPNLPEAKLAIDGFGALAATVEGRLGEDEGTLRDALHQIRLAYVQLQAAAAAAAGESGPRVDPAGHEEPDGGGESGV
jgi:Domain of unknown function (DUF1844)